MAKPIDPAAAGMAVPPPLPDEPDTIYRARLRIWYDTLPASTSPGTQRVSWAYICQLAGISP